MPDNIYEKLLEAYELLKSIVKTISETKFVRHGDGVLAIDGYLSPQRMKEDIIQNIDTFLDITDELSFFFADEELAGIKNVAFKKLRRIEFIKRSEYKAKDFDDYIPVYKAFTATQKQLKNHFIKRLDEDRKLNIKSEKYTWKGNQRQLVELFEVLSDRNWIDVNFANGHLPIVEMFNIQQGSKAIALDDESFRVAWKPNSNGKRNPGDYQEIFEKIPKNLKVPNK